MTAQEYEKLIFSLYSDEEIFRDVPNFEKYSISNYGRLYSKFRHRFMNFTVNSNGYLQANLYDSNGKIYCKKIHRLVSEAFPELVPKISEEQIQINHKNEIKIVNHWSNIEWCTPKYNMNYGSRTKRATKGMKQYYKEHPEELKLKHRKSGMSQKGSRNHNAIPIVQLTLNLQLVREYGCIMDTRYQGFDPNTVLKCCKHQRESYKGFVWKYKTEWEGDKSVTFS